MQTSETRPKARVLVTTTSAIYVPLDSEGGIEAAALRQASRLTGHIESRIEAVHVGPAAALRIPQTWGLHSTRGDRWLTRLAEHARHDWLSAPETRRPCVVADFLTAWRSMAADPDYTDATNGVVRDAVRAWVEQLAGPVITAAVWETHGER